jgi:hypothetical protein
MDAELARRRLKAESCGGCGVHPSVWKPENPTDPPTDALVPVWKHCRVCELIEEAQNAGPPTQDKGWHLVLEHKH